MNCSFSLLLMIFALGWDKTSNHMTFSSSQNLTYQILQDFMVVLIFLLMDLFHQNQTLILSVSILMILMFWIILMVFNCHMFSCSRTQMHRCNVCYFLCCIGLSCRVFMVRLCRFITIQGIVAWIFCLYCFDS